MEKEVFTVRLKTVSDVKDVVNAALKMPADVKAGEGQYVVDAKSIMGMLSLNLSNPVKLSWKCEPSDKRDAFVKVLDSFRV